MQFRPFSRRVVALVAVVLAAGALAACQPVKTPVATECTELWRGYVLPGDHNYAGIGAFTGSDRYMCKPTPWQGVRAQVQHLRNYADAGSRTSNLHNPPVPELYNPPSKFNTFFKKGAAPDWTVMGNGNWASSTTYATTVLTMYNRMRVYNGLAPV